jgi:hypothetical protein
MLNLLLSVIFLAMYGYAKAPKKNIWKRNKPFTNYPN